MHPLKASNNSTSTLPTFRYSYMGWWDVYKGGSKGTDGSTGSYMMGLYARMVSHKLDNIPPAVPEDRDCMLVWCLINPAHESDNIESECCKYKRANSHRSLYELEKKNKLI